MLFYAIDALNVSERLCPVQELRVAALFITAHYCKMFVYYFLAVTS